MALFEDVYTISLPRSGNAVIKNLTLTGWSNKPTSLELGRIYWIKTTADDLEFYKEESLTNMISEGAIAGSGKATMLDVNSSDISGVAYVNHTSGEESTGEIIVTYCYEDDVLLFERDLLDHLDSSNQFLGSARFEQPLKAAKHKVDEVLKSSLRPYFRKRSNGEVDLGAITKPRQLAEAQAHYAMYYILMAVNNGDVDIMNLAKHHKSEARKSIDIVQLELDFDGDDVIDSAPAASGGRFTR